MRALEELDARALSDRGSDYDPGVRGYRPQVAERTGHGRFQAPTDRGKIFKVKSSGRLLQFKRRSRDHYCIAENTANDLSLHLLIKFRPGSEEREPSLTYGH